MLCITRKIGETVIINDKIKVHVLEVKGKYAKLGFEFPDDTSVLRNELYERIRLENQNAAQSVNLIDKILK
ncbi:carbon storage regulator CsrA [Candidatus Nucleicultrix amoebiphila]|jgi:carbon storage regulator|uniref:Translational regulator CsrA n=1 Tax=Candidatus Nucleicultrix amoebiphila FS5 TaxID=1414854 RepID=A0A1W6N3J7_9PROT|nr:carbon storage regulator CsrA [Candidatus Nucleicultrix amoebiphila]ARN84402.1 hypothetical protein GQ61_02640 [Candidatus Nucleicultrix amoebiphila FS5]